MKKDNTLIITELEETILRIHVHLRHIENSHNGFKKLLGKMTKKGITILSKKDKEDFIAFDNYRFYRGKLYAYLHTLNQIGSPRMESVSGVIERLRGMQYIDKERTKVVETKSFRWGYSK